MKIIYKTETGIAIVHPTGEVPIDVLMVTAVPVEYRSTARIVEDDFIPEDRTFRDAWDLTEDSIVENIDKAKEIHKGKLRSERKQLLESQDALFMKALEQNKDTQDIIKEKQRLRDITKEVDKCKTIEDIKKIKICQNI